MAPRQLQLGATRRNRDEGVDRKGALNGGQGEMTTETHEATVPWQQEGFGLCWIMPGGMVLRVSVRTAMATNDMSANDAKTKVEVR